MLRRSMTYSLSDRRFLPLVFLVFFLVVILRCAWQSDDGLITMRTIDNFVHGYGLRFNIVERVQAFTHPLWMFVLTPFYLITKEAVLGPIIASMLCVLGTCLLLIFTLSRSTALAVAALGIMASSRSIVDYSTSGLENPLSFLLLAGFFALHWRHGIVNNKHFFWLNLIAALAVLNRNDLVLLLVPSLLLALFQKSLTDKWGKRLLLGAAAWLPLLFWLTFAFFYFGSIFPNTAYAKLNVGIPAKDFIDQGIKYFFSSYEFDPVLLVFPLLGITGIVLSKDFKLLAPLVGVLLYLVYIIKIGGDFMAGRFFAVPAVVLVCLFVRVSSRSSVFVAVPALLATMIFSLSQPLSSLTSGKTFDRPYADGNGVADERGFYYQTRGLLSQRGMPVLRAGEFCHSASVPSVSIKCGGLGAAAFGSCREDHFIDSCALTDAFLSRQPIPQEVIASRSWRIGHFDREISPAYVESIKQQKNLMEDAEKKALLDRVMLLTRAPVFAQERVQALRLIPQTDQL